MNDNNNVNYSNDKVIDESNIDEKITEKIDTQYVISSNFQE